MRNDVGLHEGGQGWRDKTWLDSGCVLKAELVGSAGKSRVQSDGKRRVKSAASADPLEGGSASPWDGSGRGATRGSVVKPLALDWLLEIQTETAGRPGVSVA